MFLCSGNRIGIMFKLNQFTKDDQGWNQERWIRFGNFLSKYFIVINFYGIVQRNFFFTEGGLIPGESNACTSKI